MIEWLKKLLSPNWERRYVVEISEGKHRYEDRESAEIIEWVYAYTCEPTERYTEWKYVGEGSGEGVDPV